MNNENNRRTVIATDLDGNPVELILKPSSQTKLEPNLSQFVNSSEQKIVTADNDGTQHWYCPCCGDEIDISKLHGCESEADDGCK